MEDNNQNNNDDNDDNESVDRGQEIQALAGITSILIRLYSRSYSPCSFHLCNAIEINRPNRSFPKCARCNLIKYCCRRCQRDDWPNHRAYCVEGVAYRAREDVGDDESSVPDLVNAQDADA